MKPTSASPRWCRTVSRAARGRQRRRLSRRLCVIATCGDEAGPRRVRRRQHPQRRRLPERLPSRCGDGCVWSREIATTRMRPATPVRLTGTRVRQCRLTTCTPAGSATGRRRLQQDVRPALLWKRPLYEAPAASLGPAEAGASSALPTRPRADQRRAPASPHHLGRAARPALRRPAAAGNPRPHTPAPRQFVVVDTDGGSFDTVIELRGGDTVVGAPARVIACNDDRPSATGMRR